MQSPMCGIEYEARIAMTYNDRKAYLEAAFEALRSSNQPLTEEQERILKSAMEVK